MGRYIFFFGNAASLLKKTSLASLREIAPEAKWVADCQRFAELEMSAPLAEFVPATPCENIQNSYEEHVTVLKAILRQT